MIYLASDHRGFELKEKIKQWLKEWSYDFEDLGPTVYDADDDYPDYVFQVGQRVSTHPGNNKGIVLGHSGQGEAIVANKYQGVRAIVYYGGPQEILTLSREHNNANVLSLGASFIDIKQIQSQVKLWLETEYVGDPRHERRIKEIKEIEETGRTSHHV